MISSLYSYGNPLLFEGSKIFRNRWNQYLSPQQQLIATIAITALNGLGIAFALFYCMRKLQVRQKKNRVVDPVKLVVNPVKKEKNPIIDPEKESKEPDLEIDDIEKKIDEIEKKFIEQKQSNHTEETKEFDSFSFNDESEFSQSTKNETFIPLDESSIPLDESSIPLPPMNRYMQEHFLHMSEVLNARAKSCNMSVMEFVINEKKEGQLPPESNSSSRPDYQDEMNNATLNFTRLFNHGKSLTQYIEEDLDLKEFLSEYLKSSDSKSGEEYHISITSPTHLAKANLAISKMLEDKIINEIKQKHDYAGYNNKIQDTDYQDMQGILIKKIRVTQIRNILETHKIIDKNGYIITDDFNQETQTKLEKNFQNADICKKILEILYCINFRTKKEMIRLRLTKSSFLDPRLLSQMSQNQLTVEKANLLLTCLAIVDNKTKKKISICDLRTGKYLDLDLENKFRGKKPPALCFIDPEELDLQLPTKINLDEAFSDSRLLEDGTKILTGLAYGKLESILGLIDSNCHENIKMVVAKGGLDHVYLREIFFDSFQLERVFKDNSSSQNAEIIENCFKDIREFLSSRLDKTDELYKNLPHHNATEDCLTVEAETRLQEAIKAKDELKDLYENFKHILRQFLFFSTQTFKLPTAYPYKIVWEMDGIKVEDLITVEKSCAVARRLYFTPIANSSRTDLPYFAKNKMEGAGEKKDSIAQRWENICNNYKINDQELAEKFLILYKEGFLDKNEIPEIRQFLVPLVILLMGKEPSLDRSSLAANFILILSVKLGNNSFAKALETMPMIPQGAVAAKQFLLHVSDSDSLDTISGVQYKDHKIIPPSYFLSTLVTFSGTANHWIQKYDDVATAAVNCCLRFLEVRIDENNKQIQELKKILEKLYKMSIPYSDLAEALIHEKYLFDDEDEVGKWAIDYITAFHPLQKSISV